MNIPALKEYSGLLEAFLEEEQQASASK